MTSNFFPVSPQQGHPTVCLGTGHLHFTGYAPKVIIGIASATIQSELEQSELPGEMNFGHLRSARLSVGPVEEFMHLYAILLIFSKTARRRSIDLQYPSNQVFSRPEVQKIPKRSRRSILAYAMNLRTSAMRYWGQQNLKYLSTSRGCALSSSRRFPNIHRWNAKPGRYRL